MIARQLFGSLLAVVGALGFAFSGLCTLSFGGIALFGFIGSGGSEAGDYLGAALLFGVPPMVVFWVLLVIGRRLIRSAAPYGADPAADGAPPPAPGPRHGADDARRGDDGSDDDPWLSS